jgi:Xaa-Pro aminopeptidase
VLLAGGHRARALERLGRDAALIFASPHHLRNGDAEYRYRQNSDMLYLTGHDEPDCALLLRPGADQPMLLFVAPRDPAREVWEGARWGVEGAVERFGASAAFPISELPAKLPELLAGYRSLHYRIAEDPDRDRMVVSAIARGRRKARYAGLDMPDAFIDPGRLMGSLRITKSAEEMQILERAAAITDEAHRAAMRATRAGVYEYELEALIDSTFRRLGGQGPGYTTIVGGGANATILHYIHNDQPLREGELVCVDAGCELLGYTADITRTWPVGGRFSPLQARVYQIVLDVQEQAIAMCVPGQSWRRLHHEVCRGLTRGMISLGLLEGDAEDEEVVDQLIAEKKHERYYPHGTGHWLGLDVHDAGPYIEAGQVVPFAPGMVTTIEPGLYIPPGDEKAPPELRGLGLRIEDDVLITEGAPRVLTASVPKTIPEIEAWMAA